MKKLILLSALIVLPLKILLAQTENKDTIYTHSNTTIICKVKEIGSGEIKYLQPNINPDVLYTIEISQVDKIVFYNGQVQNFRSNRPTAETIEQNSEDLFQTQRKKALKIDFLSLVASTTTFTYEQCLKPGRSIEFSAGYIGTGPGMGDENPSGVLLRGGYKLMRNPDYYLKGMRYTHILKGAYTKIELDFASYSVEKNEPVFGDPDNVTNTKFAFLVVLGNQWVFNDKFLIDIYSGFGIGINSLEDDESTYPYGFATLGDNFPLALSLGMRLGILLK